MHIGLGIRMSGNRRAGGGGEVTTAYPPFPATITSFNETDGVAATFTPSVSGDFIRLTPSPVTTTGILYSHTTGIVLTGGRSRIVHTVNAITVLGNNANTGTGIMLQSGSTKVAFVVEAASGVIRRRIIGGATDDISTGGSQYADGAQVNIIYDIDHIAGTIEIGFSVDGGPRYWAGWDDLPGGSLTLHLFTQQNYVLEHKMDVTLGMASPAVVTPSTLALPLRNAPPGWSPNRAIPSNFEVYSSGGVFSTSYDSYPQPITSAHHAAVIYVDPVSGSDTAVGSEAAPLQSLRVAVLAARFARRAVIMAKPGDYTTRTLSFSSDKLNCQIAAIVPWGTGRILSAPRFPGLVWTLNTGSTWEATLTGVTGGFVTARDAANLTAKGYFSRLTSRGSIALVDANPASYFVSGTTIYVRTIDGRQPDADLHVYDTFRGLVSNTTDGALLYMKGVDIEGSVRGLNNNPASPHTQVASAVLVDCSIKYCTSNGIWAYTYGTTVTVDCEIAENLGDGISYGIISGSGYHLGIECNTVSQDNGSVSNDQNSSMHAGGTVVRVNGTYIDQAGQGVADVGSSWSWMMGCTAESGTVDNVAYFTGGTMYLDTCTALGGDVDRFADTGAIVSVSGFTGTGTTGGTGTHATYTP
jgi:hypothetical protein